MRRYPEAPTELPDGARNYESTYIHLVINWLEVAATAEFIGRHRACAIAEAQRTYRWIYRTVLRDWDALQELYERHGLIPIRSAPELLAQSAKSAKRSLNGGARKNPARARAPVPQQSRRRLPARDGRSVG